jgi:hypothetical protein
LYKPRRDCLVRVRWIFYFLSLGRASLWKALFPCFTDVRVLTMHVLNPGHARLLGWVLPAQRRAVLWWMIAMATNTFRQVHRQSLCCRHVRRTAVAKLSARSHHLASLLLYSPWSCLLQPSMRTYNSCWPSTRRHVFRSCSQVSCCAARTPMMSLVFAPQREV